MIASGMISTFVSTHSEMLGRFLPEVGSPLGIGLSAETELVRVLGSFGGENRNWNHLS